MDRLSSADIVTRYFTGLCQAGQQRVSQGRRPAETWDAPSSNLTSLHWACSRWEPWENAVV